MQAEQQALAESVHPTFDISRIGGEPPVACCGLLWRGVVCCQLRRVPKNTFGGPRRARSTALQHGPQGLTGLQTRRLLCVGGSTQEVASAGRDSARRRGIARPSLRRAGACRAPGGGLLSLAEEELAELRLALDGHFANFATSDKGKSYRALM